MRVCIGTHNKAKIQAVLNGFKEESEIEFTEWDVSSGVSNQPFSDEETLAGAINRARAALITGNGDIGIGLEGGVQLINKEMFLCNWGALALKSGEVLVAGGARIPLPKEVQRELAAGRELGPIMDEYANKKNVRHKEGAIGIFTNQRVDRASMFQHVMELLIGQYECKKKKV